MANILEVDSGYRFYGMKVVDYALSSDPDKTIDYEKLLSVVALERSFRLNDELTQMNSVIRTRMKITDVTAKIMAKFSNVNEDLTTEKNWESTHSYNLTAEEYEAFKNFEKYTGVTLNCKTVCIYFPLGGGRYLYGLSCTKANSQKDQARVQYLLDMQNNDLQQDLVTLQSYTSKLSDAFSTAKKLCKKVSATRKETIQGIQ